MGGFVSSPTGALLVALVAVGLCAVYRRLLPRPLPNIPHNRDAARSILGDIPEMMRYVIREKQVFSWLTSLTTRHQSAIIQAFIKPGAQPWVVVTDPFEAQDILLRRREFDRSAFFGDLIGGILPEQHIQFLSSDARFKANRNLINHLMAPTFISQVLGPHLFAAMSNLIRLWRAKMDLSEGRPFDAHADVTYMALDTIFAAMFGHPEGESITLSRLDALSTTRQSVLSEDQDRPVEFPDGDMHGIFPAALTLANSVTDTQLSPAPRLTSWVIRKLPYMRRATAIKDAYLRDKVDESVRKIQAGDGNPRTALHSVLLRERDVAEKEGREPEFYRRGIQDEFFGFMLAGHDTSAATLAWAVKFLTEHPSVVTRLRADLVAAMPDAAKERRSPSYVELARAHVPYLDAVAEEVGRHANTIAFVVRQALDDTVVLGRHIPKSTDVFLMANGPSYLEPSIPVPDDMRSPGARLNGPSRKSLTGAWDDADIAEFKPERWLRRSPDSGKEVFDPLAGPSLPFGLGPRACFGRRFAVHELKIHLALIVWHFDLLPTPPELSGRQAVQRFAREPVRCFVRLGKASL